MEIRRRIFNPSQHKGLDGPVRFCSESFELQIVHHMIGVRRRLVTRGASRLAKKEFLALNFLFRRFLSVQSGRHRIELRGGRKIDHVLHLRHMGHLEPINHIDALFHRPDRIAIEIGGALFKLGEILHGPEAAFGAVDLLIEEPPQARRVDAEPIGLGPGIRVQMELPGGVEIDMTVETGHAQAGLDRFAVVRRVEFFLRELRHQQAEPVQLHRGDKPSKQSIKVLGVQDLALGHIAQFGMRRQKDGRGELGKKTLGKIELHVKALEPRELFQSVWREIPCPPSRVSHGAIAGIQMETVFCF